MCLLYSFLWAFFLSIHLPTFPALSNLPDPIPTDPQTQTLLPAKSPPATIPAFPEQSDLGSCQLDLPYNLFSDINSACGSGSKHSDPKYVSGRLHMARCCPVLATWLYAAYSRTALERALNSNKARETMSHGIDMPLIPDDSGTCVDILEKALVNKGVNLVQPNETCDAVYCYCGIRLHPLSCPEAFYVNNHGKLVGEERVKKLEKDCLNGYPGFAGCSTCLNSLYELNDEKAGNASNLQDRKAKIRNKDCELMGLTWLLNKNRTAYIHTVSAVLRALMMTTDGSKPESCTINSDGMPLAVDSSEINDKASSTVLHISLYLCIPPLLLLPLALVF